MEWTESLQKSIRYMETHLLEDISTEDIAKEVCMSPFYFQKAFKIMTGYSVAEYIRNRRLYLAAMDVISGKEKVIDLAYKYGYDTPESFTKAFSRYHGISPVQIRNHSEKIKPFLPLKITISIQGGKDMDYVVEKMEGFQVIGFGREFSFESSYQEIPKFWDEFCEKYRKTLLGQEKPENEVEQVIRDCRIGTYGICIDDVEEEGRFRYLIAGNYKGGEVPEGMKVFELPGMEWAKFLCTGPLPGALQSVNTKIFKEWLPNNPEYEIAMDVNIECYFEGDTSAPDYKSVIWIPVKRK